MYRSINISEFLNLSWSKKDKVSARLGLAHICVYGCVWVCVFVCACMCLLVIVFVFVFVFVFVLVFVFVFVFVFVYVRGRVFACTRILSTKMWY